MAMSANYALGCIRILREVIISLFWAPQYTKDAGKLGSVQRRAMEM